MKRISSSRLAVCLSCTMVLGAAHAQDAGDKPSGQSNSITPPAPATEPAAKSIDIPDPVAVVNGTKISKAELNTSFENAVKTNGMDASKLSDDQKLAGYHSVLDDLIIEKLLKAKAADIKVTEADVNAEIEKIKKSMPDPKMFDEQLKQANLTEEKLRSQIQNGLGVRKWMDAQIAGKVEVTDADAEKFYKENLKEFEQPDQPETVQASHILFRVPEGAPDSVVKEKEAAAKAAYDKLKKGADFAKLADELTEDPSGKGKGGDLGYFAKGQMVPEFDKVAWTLKEGEISEPVKTSFGYHIIKAGGKKPAAKSPGPIPFAQVKDQLTGYLKNQKQQAAVQGVISKLKGEAKIKNNLPPIKTPAPGADAAGALSAPVAPEPKGSN